MNALHWLMGANAALWIGLGACLFFMFRSLSSLERRIRQWEQEHE